MKELFSSSNDLLCGIKRAQDCDITTLQSFSNYSVILISQGKGVYHADFGAFPFEGPVLMFSTPLQHIYIQSETAIDFTMLQFHGDFYCIEYHKEQVACNGLLFNNIYIEPSVMLTDIELNDFNRFLEEIESELIQPLPDKMVVISYLQLLLAKSSNIKMKSMKLQKQLNEKDEQMELFRKLLEENYLTLHKPNDYASLLAMSPNNLSKRSLRHFKKSPSSLIHERLILEAKKKLHLTRLSIKEIAASLNFEDEYYFSRFFKKHSKVSPQIFRNKTGISVMADK
ncbi:AraC family transcriptional activator of pobA [Pedobacter sp. UYP30]|uniref:helix-turn-helix domain-containing protein n=1 Tax=Pedobacter sp. UYP30 TaxID=1756400 RepID=UPI00339290E0